jgi:enoyl-CoA hydratase/3-hydroxyacyl-CoA dehydrogenase
MTARFANPLLATPARPLPRAVAIIGAGTIGPDIGYYLKSALPGLKLYLVDVNQKAVESPCCALPSTRRRPWRAAR